MIVVAGGNSRKVRIPLPDGGFFANKPSSYVNSTTLNFSQTPPSGNDQVDNAISGTNWFQIFFGSPNNWSLTTDSTAPQSPSNIWRGHWAAGDYSGPGGHGIGNV